MQHIAVIGGGLIGLSCADSLVRRGARVTIYEKGSAVGRGAAEFNSGMIHPSQAAPWLSSCGEDVFRVVYELGRRSSALLKARQKSMWLDGLVRTPGTLQLFDNPSLGKQARAKYEARDIPVERYHGDWDFGRYCLKFPDDVSGNAGLYMQALRIDIVSRGCEIVIDRDIRALEGFHNEFDAVIIACGAESGKLLTLPIKAEPGHALVFKRPDKALPNLPIMHAPSHSALTVFAKHIRLSGSIYKDSPDELLKVWRDIAPEFVKSMGRPEHKWTANRPKSLLGRPIIGPTDINNVYVCTGHGHMGWTLCAASGELMADIILDGRAAPEFAVP